MSTSAKIEILSNARVAPLTLLKKYTPPNDGEFDGGVYYSDNKVCEMGLHGKTHYKNVPKKLEGSDFSSIAGGFIFGGMLQAHFGHFLTESLGRLWAARYLSTDFSSVIYYHRYLGGKVPSYINDLLQMIAPFDVRIISEPTVVETLAVPRHIHRAGVLYGHPAVREMVLPLKSIGGGGSSRLYVSRAGLAPRDGGFVLESWIEQNLAAEGYQIMRPENMSIREQFAAYNAADEIIFAEGSAMHLYALVARSEQKLFVIWRRKVADHFLSQISSFGGPRHVPGKACITTLWVPPAGLVAARAVLDFEALSQQLQQHGFITGTSWAVPSLKDVAADIAATEACTKLSYVEQLPTN